MKARLAVLAALAVVVGAGVGVVLAISPAGQAQSPAALGGRDVGATHEDVYEATYVYDVMCRLKRVLEKRSGATVRVTTRSKAHGYDIADDDELEAQRDHFVLTTPRYTLDDSVIGTRDDRARALDDVIAALRP